MLVLPYWFADAHIEYDFKYKAYDYSELMYTYQEILAEDYHAEQDEHQIAHLAEKVIPKLIW
jgi:hypothetical protein